jgi:hypothetical protein
MSNTARFCREDTMDHNSLKLELGQVIVTQGILNLIQHDVSCLYPVLEQHQSGDWGKLKREDWLANNDAVTHGGRILSSYLLYDTKIWVITESDRSVTTVLLPEEY